MCFWRWKSKYNLLWWETKINRLFKSITNEKIKLINCGNFERLIKVIILMFKTIINFLKIIFKLKENILK